MTIFKDCKNKPSMMRAGFFVVLVIGSIVSLSGVAAMFMGLPDAGTAITTGLAVIGTNSFAKAVQSKYEAANA